MNIIAFLQFKKILFFLNHYHNAIASLVPIGVLSVWIYRHFQKSHKSQIQISEERILNKVDRIQQHIEGKLSLVEHNIENTEQLILSKSAAFSQQILDALGAMSSQMDDLEEDYKFLRNKILK